MEEQCEIGGYIVEGQQHIVQLVGSESTEPRLSEIASDMQYKD